MARTRCDGHCLPEHVHKPPHAPVNVLKPVLHERHANGLSGHLARQALGAELAGYDAAIPLSLASGAVGHVERGVEP
jgi:hypothetical protein